MLLARLISKRVVTFCFFFELIICEGVEGVLSIEKTVARSSKFNRMLDGMSLQTVDRAVVSFIFFQKNGFTRLRGPLVFGLPFIVAGGGGGGSVPGFDGRLLVGGGGGGGGGIGGGGGAG